MEVTTSGPFVAANGSDVGDFCQSDEAYANDKYQREQTRGRLLKSGVD